MMAMSARRIRPGDFVSFAAAGVFTASLFVWSWMQPAGNLLVIRAHGKIVAQAPLDHDAAYDIDGKMGVSRIEIRQGQVRVASDPGPHQICVKQGWIHRSGETALCLPNEVSLEVRGSDQPYDSINY